MYVRECPVLPRYEIAKLDQINYKVMTSTRYVKVPTTEFNNLVKQYKGCLIANKRLNTLIKEYNAKYSNNKDYNGKH